MNNGWIIGKNLLRSEKYNSLKYAESKLLYHSLYPFADEYGRMSGEIELIKANCYYYDAEYTTEKINEYLSDLHDVELIFWYETFGKPYIQIIDFLKHQAKLIKDIAREGINFPAPAGWCETTGRWFDPNQPNCVDAKCRYNETNCDHYNSCYYRTKQLEAQQPQEKRNINKTPLDLICATCGNGFQWHKKRKYCSAQCFPSNYVNYHKQEIDRESAKNCVRNLSGIYQESTGIYKNPDIPVTFAEVMDVVKNASNEAEKTAPDDCKNIQETGENESAKQERVFSFNNYQIQIHNSLANKVTLSKSFNSSNIICLNIFSRSPKSEEHWKNVETLCNSFLAYVAEHHPLEIIDDRKIVTAVSDADKLLRVDKRNIDLALAVLARMAADDFWVGTVKAMSGFRRNFATIEAKTRATKKAPKSYLPFPEVEEDEI
jgi:hypothetical protein